MGPTAHRYAISSASVVGCHLVPAQMACASAFLDGLVFNVIPSAAVVTMGSCVKWSAHRAPTVMELVMQKQESATACRVTLVTPVLTCAHLTTMATSVNSSATVATVVCVITLMDRVVVHLVGQEETALKSALMVDMDLTVQQDVSVQVALATRSMEAAHVWQVTMATPAAVRVMQEHSD